MIKDFDVYNCSVEFHHACKLLKVPGYFRDQLLRASGSIALNVAEGSGKRTPKDQSRFYSMALGSLRECQAILDLEQVNDPKLLTLADRLGAMLYSLSHRPHAIGKRHGNRNGNGHGNGTENGS